MRTCCGAGRWRKRTRRMSRVGASSPRRLLHHICLTHKICAHVCACGKKDHVRAANRQNESAYPDQRGEHYFFQSHVSVYSHVVSNMGTNPHKYTIAPLTRPHAHRTDLRTQVYTRTHNQPYTQRNMRAHLSLSSHASNPRDAHK